MHRRHGAGGTLRRSNSMMKRFMIERHVPGASTFTQEQLADISRTSNEAVA
jgi:hypothetical protein